MLMTKPALEAGDAGSLRVAAFHDDHGVAGIVDAGRRPRSIDAGKHLHLAAAPVAADDA